MQPSTSRFACLALQLILPVAASAQQPTASFDQLQRLIQPGDTAWIIDARGQAVRGLVNYLSPSLLVLEVGGAPRTFLKTDIESIRRRRNDSPKNGAVWGFAVGAGLGALAGVAGYRKHPYDTDPRTIPYLGLLSGMTGAGLGAVIDLGQADERIVYSRHGVSAQVSLRPILERDRKGVLAAIMLGR